MGQTTGEELLEKLRHGSRTEGRILGNDDFIQAALGRQDETLQAQIGIKSLVAAVARVYEVSAREITSASRARQSAPAAE